MAIALCVASGSALACAAQEKAQALSSPAGKARATISPLEGGDATVVVERRDGQGWRTAWRGTLPQGTAQGSAMLADDGRLLVFGDDQHALLLHDANGRLLRERALGDFLPAAYVQALPRSGHGLQWWRGAQFAPGQGRVEFSVPAPGSVAGASGPALRFDIDLRDGAVRTQQIRLYLAALDQAKTLEARTTRERNAPARLAGAGTPLPAPALSR